MWRLLDADIEKGLPIYYRNLIYTEEEREKLWIEKLNKGERWIGGSCIRRKKSIRHWVITELGGGHSKRIHMHGFIWDNEDTALKEWKNGYTYEGGFFLHRLHLSWDTSSVDLIR